jgi:murein DD-endopeptidase MepM/ murein hydrolase activator NlpD
MKRAAIVLNILLALAVISAWGARPAAAQTPIPLTPPPPPASPPFRLPFDTLPGPATWTLTQWYGNTQFAYHWRTKYYEAGQGFHFGIDFSAPCGTLVVAIGDGVVTFVDAANHGSGPHNLIIDYGNGFASLYGHLLERSPLNVSDAVTRGQVVGKTGDPDLTCTSRPHLHLEIRDTSLHYAYNPVLFIDADWDSLALFVTPSGFEQDLDHPQRWVTPYDQPPVDFWAGPLNDYLHPWPPDWSR